MIPQQGESKSCTDRAMNLSEDSVSNLLKLAGVSPSERQAAAWLREAITGARPNRRAIRRPHPFDHNVLLADIEKSAKRLITQIERLRRSPFSQHTFWRSKAFGPVYYDRVEIREVLSTLETILLAADMAKDRRQGRPRETRKQYLVDSAFAFFVRFSPRKVSGTPTGAFAAFARAFYSAATGHDPDGGIDRQIRQAQKLLAISRQRATKL
jgi:hypothetical protein